MYSQLLEYSVLVIFIFILGLLIYKNNNKKKQISALKKQIEFISSDEQKVHSENFIKFLSDSREWAFSYIEEVQNGINNFINDVDREIVYFDKYGDAIHTPMNKSMQIISKSYKNLKKLLPQDKESNNE